MLGWTVLVPCIGFGYYLSTWEKANEEKLPFPRKALVGIILILLFAAVHIMALITRFNSR